MNISHAPTIDDKHCLTFSFVASLKFPSDRRVKEANRSKSFTSGVAAFLEQVNKAVLGDRYVALTGASLPSSISIIAGDDVLSWRMQADITIPLGYEYHKFCAVVTSTWKGSRIGGEDFFISPHRFDPSGPRRKPDEERTIYKKGWWQRTFVSDE